MSSVIMGKSLSLSALLLCTGETVVVRIFSDGFDAFAKVCETFGRPESFVPVSLWMKLRS